MRRPQMLRNDEIERSSQRFVRAKSEELFAGAVPAPDDAVEIGEKDRVAGMGQNVVGEGLPR